MSTKQLPHNPSQHGLLILAIGLLAIFCLYLFTEINNLDRGDSEISSGNTSSQIPLTDFENALIGVSIQTEQGTLQGSLINGVIRNGNLVGDTTIILEDGTTLVDESNSDSGEDANNQDFIPFTLEDGIVTTPKLAANAVTTIKINNQAISNAKIIDGTITNEKIANGTIITTNLADGSVTAIKIANNSITSNKILDGTITTVDISANAISSTLIQNNAVTLTKLSDSECADGQIIKKVGGTWTCANDLGATGSINSITAGNGLSNAGTASDPVLDINADGSTLTIISDILQVADNGITSNKIQDGTITNSDISATANIDWTKIDKTGSSLADLDTRSASDINIIDSGGYFVNGDLEAALQELGLDQSDDISTGDNISSLTNNVGYLVSGDNVSLLVNDAGFLTSVDWGDIGGTLSNQIDLQNALNTKLEAGDNISSLLNDAGYITSESWSQNGNDIYYTTGNVGIGTNMPGITLEVVGEAWFSDGISLYQNAVSDGTVEANRFCTGDGETNCVTNFASLDTGGTVTSVSDGNGLNNTGSANAPVLNINVDGTTISIVADTLQVADLGITESKIANSAISTNKIADNAVTIAKLSDTACADGEILKKASGTWTCGNDIGGSGFVATVTDGSGLNNSGTSADPVLDVNVDGTTIEIVTDALQIVDESIDSNKLADDSVTLTKLSDTTCSDGEILKKTGGTWACGADIGGTGFVASITAGDGLNNSGTAVDPFLDINVDGTSLEIVTDVLEVRDLGIGTNKIAALAVTNAKLADGAVDSTKLANNAVTTAKIVDGNVTIAKLSNGECADGEVIKKTGGVWACGDDIGVSGFVASFTAGNGLSNSGTGTNPVADVNVDNSTIEISSDNLRVKDLGIVSGKLASGSVTESKISSGAVTVNKIGSNAVTTVKINDGAVTTNKLADDAVTTLKILNSAVTTDKIAAGAVTNDKLANNAVTLTKISTAICNDGEILKKSAGAWVCGTDIGGTGFVATITAGNGLTNSATAADPILDINVDDSTIEIVTDTLQLKDLGITESKLADNAVSTNKIENDAITLAKLSDAACLDGEILKKTLGTWTCGSDIGGTGFVATVTDGNGLNNSGTAANPILDVNVDGSTLAIATDILEVADLGITNAKLADNAVTTDKISNGTITNSDISGSAAIDWTKINKSGSSLADLSTRNASAVNISDGGGNFSASNVEAALAEIAAEFLRLDATNSPLTGSIEIDSSDAAGITLDTATGSTDAFILFEENNVLQANIVWDQDAGIFIINSTANNSIINSGGGNLGVGAATTPNAALDVTGDVYISNGLSLYGTTVSDGTVEANKFCTGDGETNCIEDFAAFGTVDSVTAGSGLADSGTASDPVLDVNVDGTTIEIVTDTLQIADLGVSTGKVADAAITVDKLATNSVNLAKLADSECSDGQILKKTAGDWACGSDNIGATGGVNTVTAGDGVSDSGSASDPIININVDGSTLAIVTDTLEVADLGITEAKIANGAVSLNKLAANSVDSSKIVDDSIVDADVNASAAISWTKISKTGSSLADFTTRNASDVNVADVGGYFVNGDIEAVLQELGLDQSDDISTGDNVSTLTNDAGYLVSGDNVSVLTNDSGYITSYGIGDTVTSGTNGSILFVASGNLAQDNANFFWDDSNNRLGIGTNSPNTELNLHTDDKSISFTISSDSVTHPFTLYNDQNTAASIGLATRLGGGFLGQGFSDGDTAALRFQGHIGSTNPSSAAVLFEAFKSDGGTTRTPIAGNEIAIQFGSGDINVTPANASMTILGNGNVGIGDASPDAPLDVVGDVYISDGLSLFETAVSDGTIEATQFCTGDGETNCVTDFSSLSSGSFSIGDAIGSGTSGSVLFVDSSGNLAQDNANFFWDNTNDRLGVGTNSPSYRLDVLADMNPSTSGLRVTDSTGGGFFDVYSNASSTSVTIPSFRGRSAGVNGFGIQVIGEVPVANDSVASNNKGVVAFQAQQSDGTEVTAANTFSFSNLSTVQMVIDANGNVGIGTNTPDEALDIVGKLRVTSNASDGTDLLRFSESDAPNDYFGLTNATVQANLFIPVFSAKSDITGYSSGDIYNSGFIAFAEPDVASADGYGAFHFDSRNYDNTGALVNKNIASFGSYNAPYVTFKANEGVSIGNAYASASGPASGLIIEGNTGIGDSTPDAPLDVVGDVYISDGLSLFETAVSDGTIEATQFCTGDGETNCVTDFSAIGSGSFNIGGSVGSGTSGSVLFVDSSGNLAQDNANFFWDNTNNRLGIGTTTPGQALTVEGVTSSAGDAVLRIQSAPGNIFTDNVIGSIEFYSQDASTSGTGLTGAIQSIADTDFTGQAGSYRDSDLALFTTNNNTLREIIRLEYTGRVGIGTTTPSERLEVRYGDINNSDTQTAGILISADGMNDPSHVGLRIDLDNDTADFAGFIRGVDKADGTFLGLEIGVESNHPIRFLTNGTSSSAEIARFTNDGRFAIGYTNPSSTTLLAVDGNAGIGTNDATQRLTVEGSAPSAEDATIRIQASSGSQIAGRTIGSLQFYAQDASTNGTGLTGSISSIARNDFAGVPGEYRDSDLVFSTTNNTTLTERMRIEYTGNVGIGDTTPDAALDVVGDVYITDGLSLFETAVSDGTIEATQFCTGDGETNCVTDFSALGSGSFNIGDSIGSGTSGSVLFIDSSGNLAQDNANFFWDDSNNELGIGTNAPNSEVEIQLGSVFDLNTTTQGLLIDGNATSNQGHIGLRIDLDNSTADFAGFVRGVRTAGTTFVGLEIGTETNHGIRFLINGTGDSEEVARINNNGNFGIGDTTPDAPLDVVGDVYITDGLSLFETAVSDGTIEATQFCTGDGETNCVTDFSALGGGINGIGDAVTSGTSGSILFVDSSGNLAQDNANFFWDNSNIRLGIGTNTPGYALTVGNDLFAVDSSGLVYIQDGTEAAPALSFINDTDTGIYRSGANALDFTAGGTQVLTISDTGIIARVPTQFQSAGDISLAYDLNFTNTTASYINTNASFYIQAGEVFNSSNLTLQTYNNGSIYLESANGGIFVDADKATGYVVEFANDGNNANRYGLRVQAGADDASGTTYYVDAYDGDGDQVGYLANVSGTFGVTNISDIRTKTNIADTNIAGLDTINALRVVDYNRKATPDGPQITGFIAQEVQQIYPNVVTEGENGILGLQTTGLIPVLVKAIQEQQVQIEQLQSQTTPELAGFVKEEYLANYFTFEAENIVLMKDVRFSRPVTFDQTSRFLQAVTFEGDVTIEGRLILNSDSVGKVELAANETTVTITFNGEYPQPPIITVTPEGVNNINYGVVNVTTTSFEIQIDTPQPNPINFNWQAFVKNE